MKTDKLIYFLFQVAPQGFFLLIGQPPDKANRYTVRAVELKEKAFRIDAIFEPIDANETTYFVEAQFQLDESFYGRFFSEIFLYLHQYKVRRWQGVVIYPNQAAEQKDLGAHQAVIARLEPDLIRRIYLDQLPSVEQLDTPLGFFRWSLSQTRLLQR
ncbi:MAG: DUF2887 domain-containing protein [Chloroherpetonaceae bacterium]|nr:Rpn family recombination-promoting nuclease/putative transposase [Chloroherpetonaceae bacterium]MCS7211694.1 Rpn family recombination-promoting nuclease/putative transposase [Chloroherpetonaceae bacterium]MDW8018632.1 DUF2887 domain-containing protein [Chloroherpetonaceae bacterium]